MQKVLFVFIMVVSVLIVSVGVFLLFFQDKFGVQEEERGIPSTQRTEDVSGKTPTDQTFVHREPSPSVTPTAIEADVQVIPEQSAEQKETEILERFRRLEEREKRLGIPVERGTPLILEVPTVSPTAIPSE